jgi:hypothetical protein
MARSRIRGLRLPGTWAYWHPVFHNDPAHYWLRECVTTLAANL